MRVNILSRFMLHIVLQIACYYVGEKGSPTARRLCGIVTNFYFFECSTFSCRRERWHCLCNLLPLNAFWQCEVHLVKEPPASRGLERLVETLLGPSLTPSWLPTLFLTREKRAGQKKIKALDSMRAFYTSCKWLILLVAMVTINSVSRTFVPGRFEQTPPPPPSFFGAKWFFTTEEKQCLFCINSKESHPNGGCASSPSFLK